MAGSDSTNYRALYDSPHIQDRLRLYGQQEQIFQLVSLRQRNPLSLLTILTEKFGTAPASMITDWQFRYQEFDELPYNFTMQAASVQPVSGSLIDYVSLTNSDAATLNLNHRLVSKGTYAASAVTAHTHIATTFSTSTPLNETLKIVGIGEPSSAYEGNAASSGNTWVKVLRAHPATAITGQAVAIPTGTQLTLVNSVAKTNQRPNPPVSANGRALENLIQINRESYGIGEHLTQGGGIKTLLLNDGNANLELQNELTLTRLMKTIERAVLMGRRSASEIGNESEYETGGILEFIKSANYINAGGILNVSRVNTIVANAHETSGVRELWMFGGSTYTKNLAGAYEDKRGFGESTDMTVKYGLQVNEITSTGRDGITYYVNAPILSEIGMDNQALILNLTEQNYGEKNPYGAFQIAEKVPMKDLPEDKESYDRDSGFRGTWRELYSAWGLIRRLQDTHFRVYGVTN